MNILFCSHPLAPALVDPDYEDEWRAALDNGFKPHLFPFEILVAEKDPSAAIRNIPPSGTMVTLLYRGWMLKPWQYTLLYQTLLQKNYQLINSPVAYQTCHYLPDSYPFIEAYTPKTVWVRAENGAIDYEQVFGAIAVFGQAPLMIKDYVKSQKHYWDTACFIPDASDREKVKTVVANFLRLQGDDLNEGIVLRAFVALKDLTIHSVSSMPLTQEYRLFFFNGQLLGCFDYWEEGTYPEAPQPPLALFETIAQTIKSNFFSMDIAQTTSGEWLIIELGDGQVAGLPGKADRYLFYNALHKYWRNAIPL
ncbi:ATP-grasp domain-containing protein [Taibaiella koreensis]|uniref:ATP-grasp domain-containing protein n=1 Tax=Taibaiella koreensis TaxID=1268548 RepID=UPI0013C36814|nr:ATP-grasp domain-containing protein [Taibaiella koreensis]